MYDNLPKDPVMLLSFVNTQLRDHYKSFDDLADAFQADARELADILKTIDYEYDPVSNQFI